MAANSGGSGGNSGNNSNLILTQKEGNQNVAKLYESNSATDKWFANPKMSNYTEWVGGLSKDEKGGLVHYTGNGYGYVNSELYENAWDNMPASAKKMATDIYNGINKFELNKSIPTVRKMPMVYLGGAKNANELKEYLKNNPQQQFNGFLSSAVGDKPTYGHGNLLVHSVCPPSVGAGAYIRPISQLGHEREFLWNNNSVFNFDVNSLHYDPADGYWHVNATYVGRAKDQHFDKK